MKQLENFSKFVELRKEFPYFSYDSYEYHYNGTNLEISFQFSLSGRYYFHPQVSIPYKNRLFQPYDNLSVTALDNLSFHIGMIELVSYWKAACPPQVIIRPHKLSAGQVSFWKKLFFNGLGEFFYMNSIQVDQENFMEIISGGEIPLYNFQADLADESLVAVGGGKDSAVSMGLLNKTGEDWVPFVLNPRRTNREVIECARKDAGQTIEFHREIHSQLIRLNEAGFLNGHTPFSALLAFYTLLAGYLSGRSNLILSNESSANEATVPGTRINHQYSKSYEFEKDFRNYVHDYISEEFNYFSLLRPFSELRIAAVFSRMPAFFKAFKSCNVGSNANRWCGACPKCLFSYIILSPFLEPEELTGIFGKNLLDDRLLKNTFDELNGQQEIKPFECVGTVDEVNAALDEAIRKYEDGKLPYLLEYFKKQISQGRAGKPGIAQMLSQFDPEHFVPDQYYKLLTKALD